MLRPLLPALLAACITSPLLRADETADLRELLGKTILGKETSLKEVQDFCEARIPKMPEITTLKDWEKTAEQLRRDVLEKVVYRGQAAAWRDAKLKVEWLGEIEGGPGYKIKKLRYEALPGLWIPALLYEPEKLAGKVPVAMNVNGHDGKGKAADYKQLRCINMAKRGMIALNVEWLGMGQLRGENYDHTRMNQLDLCGTPGLAPFYLSMKRGLDVLLAHEHADPQRVAVAGLSGGGWQTITISSLDTRVTLANPVAGYSSFRTRVANFSDLGDSEQTPSDLATVADYDHLTAMMAPRGLLLTYNVKDNCCFASGHAMPSLLAAARPVYRLYGHEDRLNTHINQDPGTHNFLVDNRQALYRVIGDQFFAKSDDYKKDEIPSEKEVKTAEQLQVEIPKDNADFHSLAVALMKDLPRDAALPTDKAAVASWQRDRAKQLSAVVKAKHYEVQAEKAGTAEKSDLKATLWRLRLGKEWTVPAVELTKGAPKETTVVVADGGSAGAVEIIAKLLTDGQRVVAVDPFYLGESKIASHDWLFAILAAAVGERPLGIQASQLAAIATWAGAHHKAQPVKLVASGPRSSLAALVAAALEPQAIGGVQLHGSMASLKEVIEKNQGVSSAPELFCFGLLEKFDIKQIAALAMVPPQGASAARMVVVEKSGDRAERELGELEQWKRLLARLIELEPSMPADEILLETRRFRVVRHRGRTAAGHDYVRETVQHPGAVVILPLLDDGRVCLIRNYRVAVDRTLIELPAGTLEPGEDPAECARRELEEETGYVASRIEPLIQFYMSPGILNEQMHAYVATELTHGPTHLEAGEEIEPLLVSWDEALRMTASGEIQDAKTLATMLHYELNRGNRAERATH